MPKMLRSALELLFTISIRTAKALRDGADGATLRPDGSNTAPGTGTQPAGDTAFLNEVKEPPRNIEPPGEPTAEHHSRAAPLGIGLGTVATRFRRLRELVHRHWDALLAAALLAGILILVIHWAP
jgi:hypothetical protein